jgi:DNA-binding MarR family transcriptional regulator
VTGARTLKQTEDAVSEKLGGLHLDMAAMTAMSNLYRTASAVRNHFEQTVLKPAGLTWTGFVVLWVVWIWDSMETRHVAEEAGINKGTLTGVVQTLEGRGLVAREIPATDRRRTFLSLTPEGQKLMAELFPQFNAEEQFVVSTLSERKVKELGSSLRSILAHMETNASERR